MKVFAVLLAVVATAAATTLPVVPVDSSIVKSARTGGNFAYSVQENRGFVAPVAPVAYAAAPVAYAPTPVAYSAGFVKPEYVKPVEYKTVEYKNYEVKPITYAAQYVNPYVYSPEYIKPVEYKPVQAYSAIPVKTEFKQEAVKPEMYEKVAVGYYGAPVASAYSSYPYAYTYPYNTYNTGFYPYNTFPYGVVKAEK